MQINPELGRYDRPDPPPCSGMTRQPELRPILCQRLLNHDHLIWIQRYIIRLNRVSKIAGRILNHIKRVIQQSCNCDAMEGELVMELREARFGPNVIVFGPKNDRQMGEQDPSLIILELIQVGIGYRHRRDFRSEK